MRQFDGIGLQKAILWEEAKGKLRAIVAAEGNAYGGVTDEDGKFFFERVEDFVEKFIHDFENQGYHE